MALQYQSISHGDLGGSGIDALSSEDAIQDGYAEDLLNVDASPQGYLSKRVGYQQIYGQLPVRVLGMQYLNPTTVEYTLDSSIDLTKIQSPLHSRPVVIAGKTSYQAKTGGGTVTVLAAPTYIFRSSISIPDGQIIYLQTSGTMPGNIDQNVRYEVKLQTGSTTDFQILSTTTGAPVTPTSGGTSGLVWYPAGDFIPDAFSSQYYPNFDADVRRVLQDTSPASSTVVISATEHGLKSPYMVIGCSQSTSLIKRDNIAFNPNGVSIEQVSLTVRVDEISGVGENQFQYIYWADRSPSPGYTYISDYKTIPTGEYTVSIEAPTHGLTSRNIQALAYRVVSDGGVIKYQQVFPNAVRIKKSGEVQVTFLNGTGSSFQLFLILSVVDPDRVLSNATKDANNQIKFAIYADNPFLFASCYQDDGDDYVQVYPDSVQFYDSNVESEIHTEITFQLTSADSKSLHVFWEPGYIISNRLRVTANTSLPAGGSFVDSRPQLTLWGFDHSNLYLNPTDTHAGWVTHLDTYRSAGNNFLVAGLGGNLFSGQELDTGTRVSYKVPTLYPSLRGRSGESVVCGPAFEGDSTGVPPTYTTRTGGAFFGSGWGDGFAEVKGLTYVVEDWDGNPVPKAGYVKIEIEIKNSSFKILPDTDGHDSVINAGTDWIKIQGAGNPIHNGTWRVLHSESDVPNQALTFYAQNLTIQGLLQADSQGQLTGTTFWNCENARCGIFSGRIVLSDLFSKVSFIPGDTILSSNLTAAEPIEVTEVTKNDTDDFAVLNLNNFYQIESFPSATTIVGRRTSNVIPLRDDTNQETTFGFVGTDNLKLSNYVRQFKIKTVNSLPTTKIEQIQFSTKPEVDGDITYYPATITLDATNTARPAYFLAKGDRITVAGVGAYSTTYTVSNILNDTQITLVTQVASSTQITWGTGGYYPHLVGKTVYIDEEILWQDSLASNVTAQVPGRWLPIEAPEHTSDLAPTTYKRYLENSAYDEQPILRSTQVADTLFLNNGDDRTLKVDGSSLYRPGLIRWQPELFFAQSTGLNKKSIPLNQILIPSTGCTGWSANHFLVTEEYANSFPTGTRIRRGGDSSTIYTVTGIQTGTGSSVHVIYVDKTIIGTSAPDTLTSVSTYSYYFRLNAVDANQNVVASAATGSYDCTIQITETFQNKIRMVGLPTLDIYDYERLEVQIYRTKQNGVAPYYLLTTIGMSFDANQGYIDWVDTVEDADIGLVSQLDPVNTALKGQELGTGWSAPVRAKHLTSAANRLVLANLTSDPYIDLVIRNIGGNVYSSNLDGKRFLLRKSNSDTALDSNMVDRIGYRFTTDNKIAIQKITSIIGGFQVDTDGTPHSLSEGNWVYLFRPNLVSFSLTSAMVTNSTDLITLSNHGFLNGQQFRATASGLGLTANGVYYVINATTNTFQLSLTFGGSAVALDNSGGPVPMQSLNPDTYFMGWWQVKSVSGSTFSVDWPGRPDAGTYSMGDQVNTLVTAYTSLVNPSYDTRDDIPVYLGEDYNWQTSNGQPKTDGKGIQNLATRRWASAINATQRMVNPQVTGMSGFRPWIVANAGGEFSEGQIVLTQPMNQATPFELVLPDTYSNFAVFANGIQRSQGEQVQAREDLHPSRILVSYPNFPEIFDSPFSVVDSQSDSAVDINPADGQEITGVVPFFGSSAFGAALKDAVVVVFKTNSIYVVNLAAKAAGQNPVQKIESQGLGCMASYSIAPVRDGIMFANASGIYKLRTDLSIYYMGRYMQRQWRNRVNKDKLDLVFGHNWAFGSQYKLSLPVDASSVPDETFVYNSTREYSLEGPNTQAHREGSWVRHRGFSSIGWCNLDADSFHANTGGQVMILRRTGGASDWRDDAQAIQMDVVLRAMDFGDEGIRKTVPYALVSYRNPWNQGVRTGTQVFYTTDLFDAFYQADPTVIPNRAEAHGLSDEWSQKVVTFRYSFNNKRGIRFQIRIKNELKDESVEIARVRYSVAGLSIKGVMQAAKSPALYNT